MLKLSLKLVLFSLLLSCVFSSAVFAATSNSNSRQGPSEEERQEMMQTMIEACSGQEAGAVVSVAGPQGREMAATCQLMAIPNERPERSSQGGERN
jgi:hypothetical protein